MMKTKNQKQTPALASVEMMQCVASALPISARKGAGAKGGDALAPLLALPHFDLEVVKRLRKQRVNTLKGERDGYVYERQRWTGSERGGRGVEGGRACARAHMQLHPRNNNTTATSRQPTNQPTNQTRTQTINE